MAKEVAQCLHAALEHPPQGRPNTYRWAYVVNGPVLRAFPAALLNDLSHTHIYIRRRAAVSEYRRAGEVVGASKTFTLRRRRRTPGT
jgi:hypothetical protein